MRRQYCSTVLILFCISTSQNNYNKKSRKNEEIKNIVAKWTTELKILWFVVYSDCWRFAVANNIYFIMHCMNQARQNYIELVTSLLFLLSLRVYLALVCFLFIACVCLCSKFKEIKKCAQNNDDYFVVVVAAVAIVAINVPFFSSSVSLHIFNAFIFKWKKKSNKNI